MTPSSDGDSAFLSGVKKVILVLSGKGGVGKSTVSVQLALSHQMQGLKVGVLDIDLCGPSIPRMLGIHGQEVHQSEAGWCPVYTDQTQTLGVISIGFLLTNQDDAVVWRGPKKTAMIKQFLSDVVWNDRDVLIIDTPPGSSDEHITVMEALKESGVTAVVDGAVLVTTPQAVAVGDVRREVTFCRKVGLKILGIIENMSGYVCPNCSECTNIFSSGGVLGMLGGKDFLGDASKWIKWIEINMTCNNGQYDYEILNMNYVLGIFVFNSNQIYDTKQMLRMISTMYSRLY